jgi:uncharacterized protein (TIGR02646 family)
MFRRTARYHEASSMLSENTTPICKNREDKTEFARSQFDRLDKAKLRAVMYREQRSICVFCERQVAERHPEPHIDHWKPLSVNHEFALHWKNLYLSCPSLGTCDDAKGDTALRCEDGDSDLPWPTDLPYENLVGFTSGGEIYVRTDANVDNDVRRAVAVVIDKQPHGAGYRPAILNLNHPALVAARAAAIDAERNRIEKEFAGRTASRPEREQRAAALLAKDPLPGFVSVRVAWLRKFLGRGRG